jgi:hypothetical protein
MGLQEIPDLRGFSNLIALLYQYRHHYYLSVNGAPDISCSVCSDRGLTIPGRRPHRQWCIRHTPLGWNPPHSGRLFYQQLPPKSFVSCHETKEFMPLPLLYDDLVHRHREVGRPGLGKSCSPRKEGALLLFLNFEFLDDCRHAVSI